MAPLHRQRPKSVRRLLSHQSFARALQTVIANATKPHRGVKSRIKPMLGFKDFGRAAVTIAGVELLHRIRKGQFNLAKLRLRGQAVPAIWNAVLSA